MVMVNSIGTEVTIFVVTDEIIAEIDIIDPFNNSIIFYSNRLGFEGVE